MEAKYIPGYSRYRVTQDGTVLNDRGMILSDYDCKGYRRLSLMGDNKKRSPVDIHRLVVSAWIGPIPKGMWVNHKNGIKHDNRVENLEIVTPSYNIEHSYKILGRRPSLERNKEREELINLLLERNWSQHKIAKALGVSQPAISQFIKYIQSSEREPGEAPSEDEAN